MRLFIKFIAYILAFFIKQKHIEKIIYLFNVGYNYWIKKEFKKVGENTSIKYPLHLTGANNIEIGENFGCDQRFRIEAWESFLGVKYQPIIKIGDNVSIQKDCHITAINKIIIGNNVLIASKVFISDHSHGQIDKVTLKTSPASRHLFSKGPVIINDNVWIGEGVVILSNVVIGENCIIGANSVVTKSFHSNCIIGGNPAKVIKNYNEE